MIKFEMNFQIDSALEAYESPQIKVIELQSEGVLCSSGLTEDFEDGDFNWN